MSSLAGRTLFITGASRGIGKAIALRAAGDGANVILAAKTTEPHPRLPGTIYSAAEEIEDAGGTALPVKTDVRFAEQVEEAVEKGVEAFGGIDIVVNNASAIFLAGTADTPVKRFDLMHQVNVRATFLCSRLCLPWLERSDHSHVLNLAPPPRLEAAWFARHLAYTLSKYGMSFCVLGMAEELREHEIGVNALWPRTTIDTAAVRNLLGGQAMARRSRKPEIVADAAHAILSRDPRHCTGNFFIDEEVLRQEGVTDFGRYAVDPEADLQDDLFVVGSSDPGRA